MDWKAHIKALVGSGIPVPVIAAHMRVTPSAVKEIMAGRTKSPRADAAFRLARINISTPVVRDEDGRVIAFGAEIQPHETGKSAALTPT